MIHYDFVGIDIAKDKFDVALKINGRFSEDTFENNNIGHEKFALWLKKHTNSAFIVFLIIFCKCDKKINK